jgi:hypothetical protein
MFVVQPKRPGCGYRKNEREHSDDPPTSVACITHNARRKQMFMRVPWHPHLHQDNVRQARSGIRRIVGFVFPH